MNEGKAEAAMVQGFLETGEPLPAFEKVPLRCGFLFLLRWLTALPEPILDKACVRNFETERNMAKAMQQLEVLPRSVLCCVGALIGQLKARHVLQSKVEVLSDEALARFAVALTHKQELAEEGRELLKRMANESGRSTDRVTF